MRPIGTVLGVVLLLVGCRDTASSPAMTSPTQTTGASAAPPPRVRGIVYDVTAQGRHPLEGVGLDISVEYQSWPPVVFSGPDGRFTSATSTSSSFKIAGTKANYSQPCRLQASGTDADHEVFWCRTISCRPPESQRLTPSQRRCCPVASSNGRPRAITPLRARRLPWISREAMAGRRARRRSATPAGVISYATSSMSPVWAWR
jgi:hypothetical protein